MTAFDNDRGVGGAVSFCRLLGKIAPIDYRVRYTRCGQLIKYKSNISQIQTT
jgi:hypothetical protein